MTDGGKRKEIIGLGIPVVLKISSGVGGIPEQAIWKDRIL